MVWLWIGLAVGIFCVVRGIVDLRQRRYVWGGVGLLAGLVLLLAPIETRAVKYDVLSSDPANGSAPKI
jgi:hypothetical protein